MAEQFPSNELEVGLVAAAEGGRTVASWLADLAQAKVWVQLEASNDKPGVAFPVITVDGKQYVPVFTSRKQLESTLGLVRLVNPPVDELVSHLPANMGIAINPGGDLGLPLEPDAVQMLSGKPRTVDAGTSVYLGDPAVEPEQLLAKVADALRDIPLVKAARRCWAVVGSQPPGLVLSVDLAQDTDALREEVAKAVSEVGEKAPPGFSVDVVFDADRSEFTDWMLANTTPFFTGFTP
jgi:SseB protein C-terminal domain/SseB protein N-terminal domain